MIAISEILIKLYLFGFQSSIYRFANELSESQKNLVLNRNGKKASDPNLGIIDSKTNILTLFK